MQQYLDAVRNVELTRRIGRVACIAGQSIEAAGPATTIGEICEIALDGASPLLAEVVGIRPGKVILMPYGELLGIGAHCEVVATGRTPQVAVGESLLGRVIDAFGEPIDGGEKPMTTHQRPLHSSPMNPLTRPRIGSVIETGVRAIDSLMPLGSGQRQGRYQCHCIDW
jgi:flagellum-specific ATP synthase